MPICGGTSENVFSPFTYLLNQTGVYDKWTWGFIKRNIDGFGVSKNLNYSKNMIYARCLKITEKVAFNNGFRYFKQCECSENAEKDENYEKSDQYIARFARLFPDAFVDDNQRPWFSLKLYISLLWSVSAGRYCSHEMRNRCDLAMWSWYR